MKEKLIIGAISGVTFVVTLTTMTAVITGAYTALLARDRLPTFQKKKEKNAVPFIG